MSDTRALGAVTASLASKLADLVSDSAAGGVPGAQVTHQSPAAPELTNGDPFVNLFLYEISRNPELQAQDLPTRSAGGERLKAPVKAVNLTYLISFYGDPVTLESQRLMGAVVAGLHARPVLGKIYVEAAVKANAWLRGADLTGLERVTITDLPTDRDEMSRLWREFPNAAYQLSALYQVSGVLLRDGVEPGRALPVHQPRVTVGPFRAIHLNEPVNARPGEPLVEGGVMVLKGEGLPGPDAQVLVDGEVALALRAATARRIEIDLNVAVLPGLSAGPKAVQVRRPPPRPGAPAQAASPVVVALIHPRVAGPPSALGERVIVELSPPLAVGQTATLLLNPLDGRLLDPLAFKSATAEASTVQVAFETGALMPGGYLVQVVVEGLASPLERIDEVYAAPRLDVVVRP